MPQTHVTDHCHGKRRHPGRALVLVLVLVAASLCGCATSGARRAVAHAADNVPPSTLVAEDALSKMVALQARLYKIASPLLINNADLCKNQAHNLLGFTAQNKYSYPGQYADAAQAVLGYGERLEVSVVLAGSGAARAGLRTGDKLLLVDGKRLPTGPDADTAAGGVFGPLLASRATLSLSISRANDNLTLNLPVTRACAYRVAPGNTDNLNAYADGQRIVVTRGMLDFADDDTAIAYVVARAMADNILGHAGAQHQDVTLGALVDNVTSLQPDLSRVAGSAVRPMSPEMDAAADRLSLFLLARAGDDIDGAARFWQRLAAHLPATVMDGYTANHPATAYRLLGLNRTVAEIHASQRARIVLLP